jgi:hypothetical protein
MHESGAVVEMKLRICWALRDQRSKEVSGGRILFGFKIEAGKGATEFGIGRCFIEWFKCGDGFLRLAFSGLEFA